MKSLTVVVAIVVSAISLRAQTDPPILSSWLRNTTNITGYNGLPANVQQVRYSVNYVYVNASDIPAYTIGPTWGQDPNKPSNQNFVFKFPRNPVQQTGTTTATGLGPIATFINGVVAFNAKDANSYYNQNVWHSNAVVVEGADMDACLGHPAPGGMGGTGGTYHHHQNPKCLYNADNTKHSGILGYAFDGFPIYGPYAYANANGTGGIKRMVSSYRTRNIAQRQTLADGTTLTSAQYGPAVNTQYPLGYYVEDFEYVNGLGDLDAHNGRFGITPEYPAGTYAYFVTIDASGASAYPYVIGPNYYGVVQMENITQHQRVTISEPVTTYIPPHLTLTDTVAPILPTHLTCGEMLDTLMDLPHDSTISGLAQIEGQDSVGCGWLFLHGVDSTYNFDSTIFIDAARFTPGDTMTRVHIKVTNLRQNAHGALYAMDRAGNDTTFFFNYIADTVSASPGVLQFGVVQAGTSATDTIVVTNPLTTPVQIDSVWLASKSVFKLVSVLPPPSTFPMTLAPGKSKTMYVKYSPTSSAGFDGDTVMIGFPCFSRPLARITGGAGTPCLIVPDMNFGTITLLPGVEMESHDFQFVITSDGPETLFVSQIHMAGGAASPFTITHPLVPLTSVDTIPPGSEGLNITLHVNVSASSDFTDSLIITSNATCPQRDSVGIVKVKGQSSTGILNSGATLPVTTSITAIAPNPSTRNAGMIDVQYALASRTTATITISNILGEEIRRVDGGYRDAGVWRQSIDVSRLAPGAYAVRLSAGGRVSSRMMIVR